MPARTGITPLCVARKEQDPAIRHQNSFKSKRYGVEHSAALGGEQARAHEHIYDVGVENNSRTRIRMCLGVVQICHRAWSQIRARENAFASAGMRTVVGENCIGGKRVHARENARAPQGHSEESFRNKRARSFFVVAQRRKHASAGLRFEPGSRDLLFVIGSFGARPFWGARTPPGPQAAGSRAPDTPRPPGGREPGPAPPNPPLQLLRDSCPRVICAPTLCTKVHSQACFV